jgi:hypothetical protein
MSQCPKCGSCRISGPYYRHSHDKSGEKLEYVCNQCGYSASTPTLDHNDWKKCQGAPRR